MQYEMPTVAIKQCPVPVNVNGKKSYTKMLVSFQSTGSINLLGVNNLPGISLYVKKKERGNKTDKRTWGTEQNEPRDTYLHHYNAIDHADHIVRNA
jgi:hypothetical protein